MRQWWTWCGGSWTDRGSAERALNDAARELAGLRLELDAVKSQVGSFSAGVQFPGTTVMSVASPGALVLSHPRETVVYVDRPGSLLRNRGERMVVEHNGEAGVPRRVRAAEAHRLHP